MNVYALGERFEGRGRVVLTASRATEYSFEGDQVLGQGVSSHFTAALVRGLRTGEADRDNDGVVTVDELYSYVFNRTRANETRQTPAKWASGVEGDILIARSPRRVAHDADPGQAGEQVRATPQRQPDADQEARRKVEQPIRTRRRWATSISRRTWALIPAVGMGIAAVVASIASLTSKPPIMGHLPDELRASCWANTADSATCKLADGMLVLFRLFETADDAKKDVVNGNEPAPDGVPCPPPAPPSETGVVCRYSVGSATGVAMFGHTEKGPQRFYLSRWTSDAEPLLRGEMSTSDANPQDWATLQADWTRLAGMG